MLIAEPLHNAPLAPAIKAQLIIYIGLCKSAIVQKALPLQPLQHP